MCVQPNEALEMKYSSLDVASRIAHVCHENGMTFNNTKIQKLLYCCYGCALVTLGGRLCDEYPRAWPYGPVFPRVYKYMSKGKNLLSFNPGSFADKADDLIVEVVKNFGIYTAQSLSEWSHSEGSPWDTVVNGLDDDTKGGLGNFIPDDLIAEYFRKNVVEL